MTARQRRADLAGRDLVGLTFQRLRSETLVRVVGETYDERWVLRELIPSPAGDGRLVPWGHRSTVTLRHLARRYEKANA